MQRDAIERLHLTSMLLEPELLDSIQPDVHLVSSLVSLNHVMPESTKRTARVVVGQVVAEIERRIANKTRAAVTGAVSRASRTHRPRPRDIDWNATIRRNLDHYLPEQRTIVPERLVGYGRGANAMVKEVVVAIDQSGSMAESVVYAAVFGATLASIRSVKTSLVAFDTEVVDLTDKLADPVDVLFGCQLGGGTDINRALAYCQHLITRPTEIDPGADLRPLRGRHRRGDAAPGRRAAAGRRHGRGAARAVGLGRAGVRPRARGRPRRAGRAGLRVHAGPVPRPARCRGQQGRHRPVGCHCRRRPPPLPAELHEPPGVASAVRGSAP